MATGSQVLTMLCPEKECVMYDNDFDSIQWIKGEPITQTQFETGFPQYDAWKAEQDAKAATDKAALLAKLGISADEFKTLLGGN